MNIELKEITIKELSDGFQDLPNRECQLDWTWYIPIGNTICVFALFVLLLSNISLLKIKYKPKWKIFNWDLPDRN